MKSITATEAKNNFGDLLMNAQSSPVAITRNGKEQGILLSIKEYSKLKHQAMQSAISEGVESGFDSNLDMDSIKAEALARLRS